MPRYKPDQGRLARMAAFWSLAALWLYGCLFLHAQLYQRVGALRAPLVGADADPATGEALGASGAWTVPVVGVELTGALVIALLFAAGGLVVLYRWQNRPKTAEVLIETEKELRKVTWPTLDNLVNSTLVVVAVVLFLMGYLAAVDWFFGRLFRQILL